MTHPRNALVLLALALLPSLSFAQYKYVGPDGRVTYSDQPPPQSAKPVPFAVNGSGPTTVGLPYEVKLATQNFPVSLYTGDQCGPCDEARAALQKRGVPYAEYTVKTADDLKAFKQVGGNNTLPLIKVGRTALTGFQPQQLADALDVANYPATSKLPATYHNTAPQPLAPPPVAAKPAADAVGDAVVQPASPPPEPPSTTSPPKFKF